MSCILDFGSCHWDGSVGYCCSKVCVQNAGEQFGFCQASRIRNSTSRPPPSQLTTTTFPCLKENSACKSNGALGTCCSFYCNQKLGDDTGFCQGSSSPDIPDACLKDGVDCKADGSMGFCCQGYCKVFKPHVIGICEARRKEIMQTDNSWIIYTSLSLVAVVIMIILGFAWLYRRQRKLEARLTRKEVELFFAGDQESIYTHGYAHENADSIPYNKNLEINEDQFTIDWENPLGQGCFGVVLKGTVNQVGNVAAKTLRSSNINAESGKYLRALLCEIKVLQHIGSAENIVSMVGCNTAKLTNGKVFLFLEFCPLGSLEKFLRARKYAFLQEQSEQNSYVNVMNIKLSETRLGPSEIELNDLLNWSMQIASAMNHLAEKKVIHADLATRNILLLRKDCVKVTDFGLSRRLYEYGNYVKQNQEPLPWRWMALESLQQLTFSHQSDVWSLGITIWEIYSLGDVPYPGLTWTTDFVSNLENNLRPTKPPIAPESVYEVMLDCWKPVPDERPTFREIHKRLHEYMMNATP